MHAFFTELEVVLLISHIHHCLFTLLTSISYLIGVLSRFFPLSLSVRTRTHSPSVYKSIMLYLISSLDPTHNRHKLCPYVEYVYHFWFLPSERGPKSWEFLMRLLADPRTNPKLIKWEDESRTTFRLTQPDCIATLWSSRGSNKQQSYNNFARGLRLVKLQMKDKTRNQKRRVRRRKVRGPVEEQATDSILPCDETVCFRDLIYPLITSVRTCFMLLRKC